MKLKFQFLTLAASVLLMSTPLYGAKKVTLSADPTVLHQHVSGFGGFSPSPTWSYWLGDTEIDKMYGKGENQLGYNIMRLYISNSDWGWSSAVANARRAKKYGAYVFASPWSPPASWKDNDDDSNGGALLESRYKDWADYLNRFVSYMKERNITIDGISIQNEPDFTTEYQSCRWTSQQFIEFLSNYASRINAQIICPEDVHFTQSYISPILNDSAACANLDIVAGHFYGWSGATYTLPAQKGKEMWMTEYLINERQQNSGVDIDWKNDGFLFAQSVNDAMLADISAYVHYSLKRYYGMIGDGQYGTVDGQITKRGYILSHFAKYVSGTTRIDNTSSGASGLQTSAYLSAGGDSVVFMVLNPSASEFEVTFNLPFECNNGLAIVTTETQNMKKAEIYNRPKTDSPVLTVQPWSVSTYLFKRAKSATVRLRKEGNGTIQGKGTYTYGDTVRIEAHPAAGSCFAGWVEDSVLVSVDSVMEVVASDDIDMTALFRDSLVYGVAMRQPEYGKVAGWGVYAPGSEATLCAQPDYGYHFVCWINGQDTIYENPYTITVNEPLTFAAVIDINHYSVSLEKELEHGSIEGFGIYEHGTEIKLKAVPDAGYKFDKWYSAGKALSEDSVFTLTVHSDTTFYATFQKRVYNIVLQAASGGKVSGGGSKYYGDTVRIKAVVNKEGYMFNYWMENGDTLTVEPEYEFICTGDRRLKAMFSIARYKVSASCGEGGSIDPQSKIVRYGNTLVFNIVPDAGYEIKSVIVNGEDMTQSVADGKLTLKITGETDVYAEFQTATQLVLNEEACAVSYYGLDGRVVNQPSKGVYIVRRTYADGRQETNRILIK